MQISSTMGEEMTPPQKLLRLGIRSGFIIIIITFFKFQCNCLRICYFYFQDLSK